MSKPAQNQPKAVKNNGKPFAKGDDPRRSHAGGRKPNPQSITYWLKEFGNMSPAAVADLCDVYAKELRKGGDKITLFGLVAVRLLMAQVDEPDVALLGLLLDRTEGPLTKSIDVTWQSELEKNGINPSAAFERMVAAAAAITEQDGVRGDSGSPAPEDPVH